MRRYHGGMALSLDQRQVPELMDAPGLDATAHDAALAGLRRLNRASRAAATMARQLQRFVYQTGLTRVTMLDVACGGGDVPVEIARQLHAAGVTVELTLMDRSATALALAQHAADAAQLKAETVQGAAPYGLPTGPSGAGSGFDVVTNSLFLHHLKRDEVVATLREMGGKVRAGGCLIISDLRRSRAGYVLAWVMCRLLSRSRIVHYDGPVSVRAAWTVAEMQAMAAEAGLTATTVQPCWPWRMLLVWENTPGKGSRAGAEHG